jgi:hypothetical protein
MSVQARSVLAVSLVLAAAASLCACRRARLSRGDGAAVVVVAPRHDAAPPRSFEEQEPNDNPGQAQTLVLNAEWPVVDVVGSLAGQGESAGKDVDVFKLRIPGDSTGQDHVAGRVDGAEPEDPRLTARRLGLEIRPDSGASATLQLLDEGLKVLETVSAEGGETAGMPNMAVQAGRLYYIRVKAVARSRKTAEAPADCKYKLSLQLGDFEVADEREPNDALDTAQNVGMAGSAELAGVYGWRHDQDCYRIPLPEVSSGLALVLDGVDGVSAGVQVLAGDGSQLAAAKGRRGDPLTLHNVRIGAAAVDAGAAVRWFYVVVKGESGQNRSHRYVLHLAFGALKQDSEVEPNDNAGSASPVSDGTVSGFLPAGDIDYFVYGAGEPREISVEVSFPARVRGKVEVVRAGSAQILASAQSKKARQRLTLPKVATMGEPVLLRIAPVKGDGNANEPYALRISSAEASGQGQTR